MISGIEKAKDFYAKRGIDYIIAVVPNKEGLYSEYMPLRMQNARISDVSRTDKAIAYIKEQTNVPIINWRFPLNEAKKKIDQRRSRNNEHRKICKKALILPVQQTVPKEWQPIKTPKPNQWRVAAFARRNRNA